MPIAEQAALWLCLAFGANASQASLMREEDVRPEMVNGQIATTLISVPRHKKGFAKAREAFQTRKANRFVGRVLRELIEENERIHPKGVVSEPRPLFRRAKARADVKGMEEWEWHLKAGAFTDIVRRGIARMCVPSRTGELLKISTRRLRYTLGTRMVESGASKWALAAALDHSDLQNVDVYYDIGSGIVEHLDVAMAMVLAKRAQHFASIVENEEYAINGDLAGSRRYFGDRDRNTFEPVGTCGHNSFCNVTAPYGCYLCPKFQAWMDGPHDLVLDGLIENRTTREQLGLDPKIVSIEDELIASVAGVINRISLIRNQKERGDDQPN